jgi:TldD protein
LEEFVDLALVYGDKLGVPFIEVRLEDDSVGEIRLEKGEVKESKALRDIGLAVRVIYNGVSGFAFTTRLRKDSVEKVVEKAFQAAKVGDKLTVLRLPFADIEPVVDNPSIPPIKKHPKDVSFEDKKDMVMRAHESAEHHGKSVSSIIVRYGEAYGKKIVANSEGTRVKWDPWTVEIVCMVISKEGEVLADAWDRHGGSIGLEIFKERFSPEQMGENAAKWAAEKLRAKNAPAGKQRAIVDNNLTGVLAHESFGHQTEADLMISGAVVLKDNMGEKLGSENATIVDEGIYDGNNSDIYRGWWCPVDDEGVKAEKVVMLDEGILSSSLNSRGTAKYLGTIPTGNARALDFRFEPIVRMRNTYFTPGDLSFEESLKLLKDGIYAVDTMGGQAGFDGTFMFKAMRGYLVRNGEIVEPLRDVAITGNILDFLKNVEGATRDFELHGGYFGGCGKGGQGPLFVADGGPKLLLGGDGVQFGGEI